jgi:hypothetical protein
VGQFDRYLERGTSVGDLLAKAGMDPAYLIRNRSFSSHWAWDDGNQAFVTVWFHDMLDADGIPKWSATNPAVRTDLGGAKLTHAQERFDILARRSGQPVRVILQKLKEDKSKWASGHAEARGVDPEPWFALTEGDTVLLQRGSLPGRREVSVDGEPMSPREPSLSLRETRPDQIRFRKLVAAKTGNRCALTGAPHEVCDAAHFPWADWHTDNEAHHGALLRRDLHAAVDCGLIKIERSGHVAVSEYLASASDEYRSLHGKTVPIGIADEIQD